MKKIATHNSASGERPKNLLSCLVLPFARTQSKTIEEQYNAGCRYFDIRVKWVGGELYCAHGLFTTARTAHDILREINGFPEKCYVILTYEGRIKGEKELEEFRLSVECFQQIFRYINWGQTAVKYTDRGIKVDWKVILPALEPSEKCVQGFLPLDGRSWQTYLPIPWLWKKIYHNRPKFSEENYLMVDFL